MIKSLFTKKTIVASKKFTVSETGIYQLTISASCQRGSDLCLELDKKSLRELPPYKYKQFFNIPPAWNGAKLKGKSQTNIYILPLEAGEHQLEFFSRGESEVKSFSCQKITNLKDFEIVKIPDANNLERQPWFNLIIVDLPLKTVETTFGLAWYKRDGDDVKITIDGKNFTNSTNNWLWRASKEQELGVPVAKRHSVTANLSTGTHYIEFFADRSPQLQKLRLNLLEDNETKQFIGDFECKPVEISPNRKVENVLAIAKKGVFGINFKQSNDNYELYFNNKKLSIGSTLSGEAKNISEKIKQIIFVEMDLLNIQDEDENWFYFGIDTTLIEKNNLTILSASNWLNSVKNMTKFSWKNSQLWSIYEKQN